MDINIESQIVVQTAAEWAADIAVYSEKRILITSDEYFLKSDGTNTNQPKFKIADGVHTWSELDYFVDPGGVSFQLQNEITERHNEDDSIRNDLLNEANTRATNDASIQAAVDGVSLGLYDHINDTSNPHLVTKTQVGLGNVQNIDTSITTNVVEGTNLYFTTARVLATVLSGLSAAAGSPASTDTILQAMGKVKYFIDNIASTILGQVLTGFAVAGSYTAITASDNILTAFGKIQKRFNNLGDAADKNTGTTAGTVAAGDRAANTFSGYQGYALSGGTAGTFNPADSTSYFIGTITTVPTTFSQRRKVYIPKAGTITKIQVAFINASTVGSNETSTVYIRLNNTTETQIDNTIDLSQVAGHFTGVKTVSIPVVEGDFFEIKWVTPAWVTNPANVHTYWAIYIE